MDGHASDRLAIIDVIARYAHAWDDRDAETYADCYTDDAVFESYIRGDPSPHLHYESRVAIDEWARAAHAGHLVGKVTRHRPHSTVFDELTPERARTRTMLLETVYREGDGAPWITNTGVYLDEWRRTPKGWRLAYRAIHHDRSYASRPMDGEKPE